MPSDACTTCGSDEFETETIVEHDCGYIVPRTAFADRRCPKCEREVSSAALERVSTVRRCLGCGRRFDTTSAIDTVRDRSMPEVTFPELPSPDDTLELFPSRFVATPNRRRQLLASVLAIFLLTTGITGGATIVPYVQSEAFDGDTEPAGTVERTWNEYETIVILRNDDVQPEYKPDTLRDVDRIFIEAGVPVTHGVIPKKGGRITRNGEFCSYLRTLRTEHPELFELSLHGYTHERQTDFHGGSEFGDIPLETQRKWIEDGEQILEDCAGEAPDTFVPPMNTYDNNTVTVLDERNYTTISGGGWFAKDYFNESDRYFEQGGLVHASNPTGASMVNWDEGEYYTLDELTGQFDSAYETNEVFVFMFHYFTFSEEEQYETLRKFVQYVTERDGVTFMTVGEFGRGIASGEVQETDDGWRVLEPEDGQSDDDRVRVPRPSTPFSSVRTEDRS